MSVTVFFLSFLQISLRSSVPTCCSLLPTAATAHCAPGVHILSISLSSHRPACSSEPPPPRTSSTPTTRTPPGAPAPAGACTSPPNAAAPSSQELLWEHPHSTVVTSSAESSLHPQSLQTLRIPNGTFSNRLHEGGEPVACCFTTVTQSRGL